MMGSTGQWAVGASLLSLGLLVAPAAGILDGSVVTAAQWNRSAHRSVLSDGGGSASIILIDGDEAVLLTAGHGPQSNDPSTFSWSAGSMDPTGGGHPGDLPFTERTTAFEKYWTFDDPGNCRQFNREGFKTNRSQLQCSGIARSGGCDGADVALFRMKITEQALGLDWPTVKLALDYVPAPNATVSDTGYGCTGACDGDRSCQCVLNTGLVMTSRLYSNQVWSWGERNMAKHGGFLPPGVSVDCAGDSGGPLLVPAMDEGGGGVFGVNSQGDNLNPTCPKQSGVCAWAMSTAAWLYPQRAWIKSTLQGWKTGWGEFAQFSCEAAGADGRCGRGCKRCPGLTNDLHDLAPHGECYPDAAACPHSAGDGVCCTDDQGNPAPCAGDPCFAQEMVPDPVPKELLCKGVHDQKLACRKWRVSVADDDGQNGGVVHLCVSPDANAACPPSYQCCGEACGGWVRDWEPHAALTARQVGSSRLLRTPGLKTTDGGAQPGTKRGLVGGFCNHTRLFEPHARNWQYDYTPSLAMRDASWAHDPACREIAAEKTFEFVPMVASLSQLAGASSKLELVNSRHLLGMNEPSDGKNESAALAASRWNEYEALAATASPPLLLGTPAPGGLNLARGQRWLHDFFGNCTGCRVDIVAVHWYECDGSTDATAEKSAEGMMRFLAEVWAAFSKPIWLTEFNCGDGDPADNPYANQSAVNHLRFMKAALPKLEAAEHVARYSWFQAWQRNTPAHPGHNPGCSLTTTDGSGLSELGEYYNSFQLKNDDGSVAGQGVQVSVHNNTVLGGSPVSVAVSSNVSFHSPGADSSAEILGTLTFPTNGSWGFSCGMGPGKWDEAYMWLDDHLVCQNGPYGPDTSGGRADNPLTVRAVGQSMVLRLHLFTFGAAKGSSLQVKWTPPGAKAAVPIPSSALQPQLSPAAQKLHALRKELRRGWGNWVDYEPTALVLLPDSVVLTTDLVHAAKCPGCTTVSQPSLFAADHSYAQQFISSAGTNISVEFSASNRDLVALVSVVSVANAATSPTIHVAGRFAFQQSKWAPHDRVTVEPANPGEATMAFARAGDLDRTQVSVQASNGALLNSSSTGVSVTATAGLQVAISTSDGATVTEVAAQIQKARKAELAKYGTGDLADAQALVQAAVMYTLIQTPVEAGPFSTSTRTGPQQEADFQYYLFGSEELLGGFMHAMSNRSLAYSSVVQAVRSRTSAGFVPSFSWGGFKNFVSGSPPWGGKVLLELFRRFGDEWIVELLFPDLLAWHDWSWTYRRLPSGLATCGAGGFPEWPPCGDMAAAQFESGMSGSPMYDTDFFNKSLCLMELSDVGMSSLVAAEAANLAALATVLNRSDDAARLSAHADTMRGFITKQLWDTDRGVFANRHSNGSFEASLTPTSFLPLLAGAATDDQATTLIKRWLMSTDGFCIVTGWPAITTNSCFWGLPSVAASDPAYSNATWRGAISGTLAQLTWWGLQAYDHLPIARTARSALAKQMTAMALHQWRTGLRVCQGVAPSRDDSGGASCVGNTPDHTGALAAMVGLLEAGLFPNKSVEVAEGNRGKCPVPVGNPAVHKGSTFSHPVAELNTFTNIMSYAECCARCGAAPKCYALTWVGNDSSTHPNTCWLRAQVGPLLAHPHPVSYSAIYPGRKPCAPPACTFPPPPPLPKPPPPPPPKPGGCVHLHGVCSRTVHCCAGLKCNGSGGQFRCRNK
eukprot:COSAG04_NODE_17_length_40288_cov_9.152728_23_plen_1697_part_00